MRRTIKLLTFLTVMASVSLLLGLIHLYRQLPEVESLRDIKLQVPLRIFSSDKKLIAEFGEKRRIPVTIDEVPTQLIQAFITTEDRRFYSHAGVDLRGLARAAVHLATQGNKGQGGSTITMQVARNFFLTRKKTYSRKLNEILLAIKIEQELNKDEILELYLNKVFLGYRAYGVAAAAEVYYGKSLDQLSLAESAIIAGLPKAPSAINPIANPKAAQKRRQLVLNGMLQHNYISRNEWQEASDAPITAHYHGTTVEVRAPYVAEMVRQDLLNRFGANAYTEGYQVFTTLDSRLQSEAEEALQRGVLNYDQRHGLRRLKNQPDSKKWPAALAKMPLLGPLQPAVVTEVLEKSLVLQNKAEQTITVDWENLAWARKDLGQLRVSYFPKTAADIAQVGDLVYLYTTRTGQWRLGQVPEAEGALISLSPQDGRILALLGGFDYRQSKFNRITQAELQPGSNFKPFIYTAALANGYTPASIINDAPIVFADPAEEALWRPQNDNLVFAGPTSLRTGLIRSRNLVSIRLLRSIGINTAINYLSRFGFRTENMPRGLSLALGSANVTPLEIARGFAILANGGYGIQPHFIDSIDDSNGERLYSSNAPVVDETATAVIDSRDAYIMNSLLQDAVQRGTARGVKRLNRHDIAGKTGTTNDQLDAWFSGFNSDIATTVWMGFDNPRSLGEYAAQAALPIWRDYMQRALAHRPEHSMSQPPGLITVKIDPQSGLLAHSGQKNSVFEIFRVEDVPKQYSRSGQSSSVSQAEGSAPEQIF